MHPTAKLRWINREFAVHMNPGVFGPKHMGIELRPVLQQWWEGAPGCMERDIKPEKSEWRDIEVVNEIK